MPSKRDSEFASELLSMRPPAKGADTAPAAAAWLEPPSEQDFEGTETVVLASESGSAGVPGLDDLRRLSKQIHKTERWKRNSG